ncbi:MAG: hypothetical protein H0X40_02985 [Chthoniobacterales bacterium]|nr:hypothetical protein [Chthoniobacterales bacterium]
MKTFSILPEWRRSRAGLVAFALAEGLAEIRLDLQEAVDCLEKEAGGEWTAGLRVSHFAKELFTAKAHLSAATVIWGRFSFAVDQIAAGVPNEAGIVLPNE